jgi:hypothetical protein
MGCGLSYVLGDMILSPANNEGLAAARELYREQAGQIDLGPNRILRVVKTLKQFLSPGGQLIREELFESAFSVGNRLRIHVRFNIAIL